MKSFFKKPQDYKDSYFRSLFVWTPLIVVAITLFLGGFQGFGRRLVTSLVIAFIVFHFAVLARIVAHALVKRVTTLSAKHPMLRSRKWNSLLSLVSMPLGLYVAFSIVDLVGPRLGLNRLAADETDYRFGLFIGAVIVGTFFLFETRSEARAAAQAGELRVKSLENERLQAQLSAMTAQMNPHLLFNALNSIAELVNQDPARAEETILQLSELYRGVLQSSREVTHSLDKELALCQSYLAIEKVRFGARLSSRIEIASGLDAARAMIPALSLQPLVENAVKHGLSPLAKGGTITITARPEGASLVLSVEDDGVGWGQAKTTGAGTGLANCRERVRLQYDGYGEVSIAPRESGGTSVRLTLPLDKVMAG